MALLLLFAVERLGLILLLLLFLSFCPSSPVVLKLKFDENSLVVVVLGINCCVFLCRDS